jgi:hypothetical protein
MSWLGTYPLGGTAHCYLRTKNSSGVPTAPDDAPRIVVLGSSGEVYNSRMPALDPFQITGLFHTPLFIGAGFAAGHYSAVMTYDVGSHSGIEQLEFEVKANGDVEGNILAMHFFRRPHADFLVWQTESGKIKKGRNPYL